MRIAYTECAYDPDPENGPETDGPQREAGENENDFWERRERWYEDTRIVIRPEPGVFEPQENPPKLDLREKYGKRGLQVIVKLANVELTPDKPDYEGGTWHVEGQLVSFLPSFFQEAISYIDPERTYCRNFSILLLKRQYHAIISIIQATLWSRTQYRLSAGAPRLARGCIWMSAAWSMSAIRRQCRHLRRPSPHLS